MAQQSLEQPLFQFGSSAMNFNRCISPDGFNYNPESDEEFNLYMIVCMTEELGEVAGPIKKLVRGFNKRELVKMQNKWKKGKAKGEGVLDLNEMPTDRAMELVWRDDLMVKVKRECADLFTYLDLFISRNRIDIRREQVKKFNEVSEEMGCPQFKLEL